jgi:hypothetical protein
MNKREKKSIKKSSVSNTKKINFEKRSRHYSFGFLAGEYQ